MKQAKRILMAAMAAMLVFVFAGCGGQDTNTPEGAFNAGIAAVKDCDTAAMDKYLTGDPASDLSDGFAQLGTSANAAKDVYKALYSKLNCKVLSVEEEGDTATLQIEVTFLDKTQFQSNLMAAALSAGLTNLSNVSSQEEMMEKMMPVIKEAIEKTPQGEPQQTEATMVLEEGQWKIDDFDLDLGL